MFARRGNPRRRKEAATPGCFSADAAARCAPA